jgi:bis(5'-nucleosyl)-tetraphosphatase (symmetrical)
MTIFLLDSFLAEMYGSQPDLWSDELTGMARLRCITNYLTRMRLTDAEGRLEFDFKDALRCADANRLSAVV